MSSPSPIPMWYCYQCHAEMRPLMVPDPHCASCNSTFVEEIPSSTVEDDPRNFQLDPRHAQDSDDDAFGSEYGTGPLGPDQALNLFQNIMAGIGGPQRRSTNTNVGGGPSGADSEGDGSRRSSSTMQTDRRTSTSVREQPSRFTFGQSNVDRVQQRSPSPSSSSFPHPQQSSNSDPFVRRQGFAFGYSTGGGMGGPRIVGGPLPSGNGFFVSTSSAPASGGNDAGEHSPGGDSNMIPFLETLFAGAIPLRSGGGGASRGAGGSPDEGRGALLRTLLLNMIAPGAHDGQLGDYALDNEALDRIISQLMEQTNGDKPVPAPEDMIQKLPRTTVTEGSLLLQKECAVCKDDFEVTQETTELPCHHVFHDECILPWIKQSGTCPVCRYELVPQPKHHPTSGPQPPSQQGPSAPGSPRGGAGPSFDVGGPGDGGRFGGLFGWGGSSNGTGGANSRPGLTRPNATSNATLNATGDREGDRDNNNERFPGAWDLD